ncbi:MAG: phosphate/phosphite/phosphonate ABC transporter substrate-binding protein [Campylobacterota bacterium]|nr:phosphate/phosphite/phosphonate ABC transporter substrate-binding protein [Campylobacterota bacterium]
MKSFIIIILITTQLFSSEFINLAAVPWKSKNDLTKLYKPLIELLEEKTNKKVNFFITKDYNELSKRIDRKSVDIAIFGANSYVEAKNKNPKLLYLATCMVPTDHYFSLIISRKDSGIKTLKQLKNKNFAFTDKGSTSGYVYPKLMLHNDKIDIQTHFKTISMLGKHYKIYNAVATKSIDAGGCSISGLQQAIEKNGDIYHIIKKSKPIPQDPIIAAPHLKKEFIKELRFIFANANKSTLFSKYNSQLKGVSVKSDSFYDTIRISRKFLEENQ